MGDAYGDCSRTFLSCTQRHNCHALQIQRVRFAPRPANDVVHGLRMLLQSLRLQLCGDRLRCILGRAAERINTPIANWGFKTGISRRRRHDRYIV